MSTGGTLSPDWAPIPCSRPISGIEAGGTPTEARYEPLFVTVSDGHDTKGVAPLYVEETAGSSRVVRFVGDGRADYCDLLAGDDVNTVAAIVKGLARLRQLGHRGPWQHSVAVAQRGHAQVALRRMPAFASWSTISSSARRCSCAATSMRAQRILDKPSLRRRQNYFERIGRLGFRDLTSTSDIEPHLDAFFDQHTARWNGTSTPSLFQEAANRTFYRDLMSRMDGTRWLLFSLVEFDDRPIAFHYGFDYNDTLMWYKPSFDPAFAARSPGLVLVRHLIRRALEDGRRELDFTHRRRAVQATIHQPRAQDGQRSDIPESRTLRLRTLAPKSHGGRATGDVQNQEPAVRRRPSGFPADDARIARPNRAGESPSATHLRTRDP